MRQIAFTSRHRAEIVARPDFSAELGEREVRGRTIVSLISPGTELNWQYDGDDFPAYPGYASIFEVERIGPGVEAIATGDIVFGSGPHREFQSMEERDVVKVPCGIEPEVAVFVRLAAVSMSTLNLTSARPPSRVLVTGLGPVGNLAAQIFQACGYQVTAVDPASDRCAEACRSGLKDVRESLGSQGLDIRGKVVLHIECSGHEQAVLDGCDLVQEGGEIVLVGVPWQRKTELYSFDLLNSIFYRYVTVRSGWEWQVPRHPEKFIKNSIAGNLVAALNWIATGRLVVTDLAMTCPVEEAPRVYAALLDRSLGRSSVVFKWRDP